MTLTQLKHAARELSLDQIRRLDTWLHDLIRKEVGAKRKERSSRREVVEERSVDNRTYRLEGIRCGKEKCKCAQGQLHGPYWYAYWSEGGKTKTQYIGKKLPQFKTTNIHKQKD
jgi:hypothetical protein